MIFGSRSIYLSSLILLLSSAPSYQQNDCSYINGQGCYNGICKFCAMCLPSACILATPLSTGVNEGSTCAVTHQTQGYDFYNYCLSSDMDDNGDYCNTSTICYSYSQGNASSASHSWDNLTCDSNTCNLINFDGSPPITPIPLDNSTTNSAPTNVTTNHPVPGTGSGNSRPQHHNQFDIKTGSPASIALTVVCIILAICLLAWLTRMLFYKSKYWPVINKYFCCGVMPYRAPRSTNSSEDNTPNMMENSNMTPSTAPPSFLDNTSRRASDQSLPSYFHQDPSPPKYEQAIVTQIRGMRFLDHHPPLSNSGSSNNTMEQPIWVPIYLSQQQPMQAAIARNNSPPQQDWATATMRHQPPPSSTTSSEEGEDIVNIHRSRQ